MTTQLTFADEFSYADDPIGIVVPTVLTYQGNSLRVFLAIIDYDNLLYLNSYD
jgi:hypothetical protein